MTTMASAHQLQPPGCAVAPLAKHETVVVVGNGMVGHRFCQRLTAQATSSFRVIVFGDEPTPAYDRIRLTSVFKGTAPEDLHPATGKWYADRGIDLRLGDAVVEVNVEYKQVISAARGPGNDCRSARFSEHSFDGCVCIEHQRQELHAGYPLAFESRRQNSCAGWSKGFSLGPWIALTRPRKALTGVWAVCITYASR